MKNKIDTILENLILDTIQYIDNDIDRICGHNGPYSFEDTPIRVLSHTICILKYKYEFTKDKKYIEYLSLIANYICDNKDYSTIGAIKCFKDYPQSPTNGVIGQAWCIEGLVNAYEVTLNKKYIDKAISIFRSQKFDYKKHLWCVYDMDNKKIGIDYVFNHQLWFAASGYMIIKNIKCNDIKEELADFIKNLDNLYDCHFNGLFKHVAIVGNGCITKIKYSIKSAIKKDLNLEKGYHLFDLYGFALIKIYSPNLQIFNSKKFKKALKYGLNINKLNKELIIEKCNKLEYINKYSYPYNSPAFEYPLVDLIFNNSKNIDKYNELLEFEFKYLYNENENRFSNNTSDPNTLNYRLYELCRYYELREKYEK